MASSTELSNPQAQALLDILSHHELYAEIQDFRFPGALSKYGPPFQVSQGVPSTSPSLQNLLSSFILKLPGIKNVSQDFWRTHVASIIEEFEQAELSESYDKGNLGIRKTLATAISALIEYPARGIYAGFDEPDVSDGNKKYDTSNAHDLTRAFKDFMNLVVYGDILDDMFKKTAETDKLADHKPIVQAAHEFGLVNLASFMHFTLIISPKGQNLLTLIDHANKLVPYTIIRQTLKIGNVASMISAMTRVVLAKMSMGSVTNWIGWTSGADEGMNLLQNIISTVLNWDIRDLKSRAAKIEKGKDTPKKDQLHALKGYLQMSRTEHEEMRSQSQSQSESIVQTILHSTKAKTELNPAQHRHALDYLSIQLSIRDREQIIKVLCRLTPDHLTQAIRDGVTAYEPMIRNVHDAVDLSDTVYDFEVFLKEMIKLARTPERRRRGETNAHIPTVGDFVQLLKKHQQSSHKFLHQCAKNGKEVSSWFFDYAKWAAAQFRREKDAFDTMSPSTDQSMDKSTVNASSSKPSSYHPGAGDLTEPLIKLFRDLPPATRAAILPILDSQALYLSKLHAASAVRLHAVVTSPYSSNLTLNSGSRPGSRTASPAPLAKSSKDPASSSKSEGSKDLLKQAAKSHNSEATDKGNPGPGAFLARWQDLLDKTPVTPAPDVAGTGTEGRGVRRGIAASVMRASKKGADAGLKPEELQASNASESSNDNKATSKGTGQNVDDQQDDEYDSDDDEGLFQDARERLDELGLDETDEKTNVKAPDVKPVIDALVPAFREMLAKRSCVW